MVYAEFPQKLTGKALIAKSDRNDAFIMLEKKTSSACRETERTNVATKTAIRRIAGIVPFIPFF